MSPRLRRAASADQAILRRAVHQAWRWRDPWDEAAFVEHSRRGEPDSYVDGFGSRVGDTGLIAEVDDGVQEDRVVCGAAWFRTFSPEAPREGFVDADTPEVVLSVLEGWRGEGLGRRLLEELMALARARAVLQLSLHVDADNSRAIGLYRSVGFRPGPRRGRRGLVMVAQCGQGPVLGR